MYVTDDKVWSNNYKGCSPGEGDISADPLFVTPPDCDGIWLGAFYHNDDIRNYDFHLKQNSPCIDTGINENAPEFDFDGNPRPYDGDGDGEAVVDIGADEYVLKSTTNPRWDSDWVEVNKFYSNGQRQWLQDPEAPDTRAFYKIAVREPDFRMKDGIEYYLETDKLAYRKGEQVNMVYRVTNHREDPVTLKFVGIFTAEKDGKIYYDYNGGIQRCGHIGLLFPPASLKNFFQEEVHGE